MSELPPGVELADRIWSSYRKDHDLERLKRQVLDTPEYRPALACESVLERAIDDHDARAVETLLSVGHSPNLKARGGFTYVHTAVDAIARSHSRAERAASLGILTMLLNSGANPNVDGVDGKPLHRAAGTGAIDAARILLEHGADLEGRTLTDGEVTPLMHAALMGQTDMVRFLLQRGADKSVRSRASLIRGPGTIEELVAGNNGRSAGEILDILRDWQPRNNHGA